MKLGLVSCTKSKENYPCKAYQMYSPSRLFKNAYIFASKNYDAVVILSAKYGLLLPDDRIEPYDLTLNKMKKQERREWANRVYNQMQNKLNLPEVRTAYFHSGKRYREYLIPRLVTIGIKCVVPLEGLSLGRQLAWYNDQLSKHTFARASS